MICYNIINIDNKIDTVIDLINVIDSRSTIFIDSYYTLSCIKDTFKDREIVKYDELDKLNILGVCEDNDSVIVSTAYNSMLLKDMSIDCCVQDVYVLS